MPCPRRALELARIRCASDRLAVPFGGIRRLLVLCAPNVVILLLFLSCGPDLVVLACPSLSRMRGQAADGRPSRRRVC